jgi:cyclopropane-fatty-acyl-phospholipid synthase
MWEFYLVASELFFRIDDGMVFQIQLAKDRHAVPLTRDYLYQRPEAANRNLRAQSRRVLDRAG